jgi:hypothetical protein
MRRSLRTSVSSSSHVSVASVHAHGTKSRRHDGVTSAKLGIVMYTPHILCYTCFARAVNYWYHTCGKVRGFAPKLYTNDLKQKTLHSEGLDTRVRWAVSCYVILSLVVIPVALRAILPIAVKQSSVVSLLTILLTGVVWIVSLGVIGVCTIATRQ